MRHGDEWKVDTSATSNSAVTVMQKTIHTTVDRIVFGIMNTYTGSNLDTLDFKVYARFCNGGNFFEVGKWMLPMSEIVTPGSLPKGSCFFGVIDNLGVREIMVDVSRPGPDPIPLSVEVKCLYEGIDG